MRPLYYILITFIISFLIGAISASARSMPVGGDKDAHGCKPSAGYSWNAHAKKCLRSWESRTRVITVAPETRSCTGVAPMNCLQVKFAGDKEWGNLYFGIKGFDFVSGFTYRLLVLETRVENPPADASSIEYTLLKVLSKKAKPIANDSPILGDWKLISFNGANVSTLKPEVPAINLSLTKDRFSIKVCNVMNGSYFLKNNAFVSSMMASTRMACFDEGLNKIETSWNIDGATYSVVALRRASGSTGPTMQLTITTKKGDIFVFGN